MSVSLARRRPVLVDVGGVLCSDSLPAIAAVWSPGLGISERLERTASTISVERFLAATLGN